MTQPILKVNNLNVEFSSGDGPVHAVRDVSFNLQPNEVLGIVGESGSGKSQTVLAMLQLLSKNGHAKGEVLFKQQNLLTCSKKTLNTIRGNDIAMIFQDPMTALNPYLTIGKQMTEVLMHHKHMTKAEAKRQSIEVLDAVRMPSAPSRFNQYVHEFSGGMRQRVMIAMALLCEPYVLIADEPTTALDVTVQAQVLHLLKELKGTFNTSIILITHDLGVVANACDQVLVMYGGQIMEQAPVERLFSNAKHPYTQGLLRSMPNVHEARTRLVEIDGEPPTTHQSRVGCPFHPRCEFVHDACIQAAPSLESVGERHDKACYLDI